MTYLSSLSFQDLSAFLKIIQNSLHISRHQELYEWLNGDVQAFIPHDILIAAWGDFSLGLIHLDIASSLPGIRTTEVDKNKFTPFLLELFQLWLSSNRTPFAISHKDATLHLSCICEDHDFGNTLSHMNSALIHGIKDQRGRQDCLYVALSKDQQFEPKASLAVSLLIPYIDAALRQVAHLPVQYPDFPEDVKADFDHLRAKVAAHEAAEEFASELSTRENEIMRWVCMGKTNSEIGQILDISFFTVKNHLQRIFRKLDVLNRAQAVAKYEKIADKTTAVGSHSA